MAKSFYKVSMVFFALVLFSLPAKAQKNFDPETAGFWDRVYFGGNFGLSFGTVTYIDLSPALGYMITQDLSAGLGVTYRYFKRKAFPYNYETNIYGGRLFARHNIGRQFFAYTEYESLNLEFTEEVDGGFRQVREWVPGFFVGGGVFLPLGQSAGINFMALYNLTFDRYRSPYAEPYVIRMGFSF